MIGVIIPDRGDRPKFLANCKRMIEAQTFKDFEICLINHKPTTRGFDLTQRIRLGFEWAKDLFAAWEEGFAALEKFRAREGHCRVHIQHVEEGLKLIDSVARL